MTTIDDTILDLTDPATISSLWEKARAVEGYDSDMYRQDSAGAWIARAAYGDRNNPFGWEIDHVFPLALGGGDHFANLRPMHWSNNVSKGDSYPKYLAQVTADGSRNVDNEQFCTVNSALRQTLSQLYPNAAE